jgi:TonB family protein
LIRTELDTNVIIVELDISAKGELTDYRVIQSLKKDKPNIDKIVISQIERWEFQPAMKDGKPVDSTLKMNFIYEPVK